MSERSRLVGRRSGIGDSSGSVRIGGRGQVNFDFLVGVSVFIFAIVFAFTVAPGMFSAPATGEESSNDLRAERAGGWLTGRDVGVTNAYCLAELLDRSTPATDCGFGGPTLSDRLPIDGPVNVSVTRDGTRQSWDAATGEIVDQSGGSPWLAAGPAYEYGEEIGIARRTVPVGGTETTITVRAW